MNLQTWKELSYKGFFETTDDYKEKIKEGKLLIQLPNRQLHVQVVVLVSLWLTGVVLLSLSSTLNIFHTLF